MADGDLNLSRRALLGVAFAAPACAAAMPAPLLVEDKARWTRALARYRRAEAAFAGAKSVPDEALYDRLGERCDRALTRLLHTPAPDVAALALKLDLTLYERFGEFLGDSADMKALKRDARRLAQA
jgi:hypothetical protein